MSTRFIKRRPKLTDDQVRDVLTLHSYGFSQEALGKMFGLPHSNIALILCGGGYKWVKREKTAAPRKILLNLKAAGGMDPSSI